MVKIRSMVFALMFFVIGQAHGMELRDVVLVEDFSDEPVLTRFPCVVHTGVLLCSRTVALEPGCEKTLERSGNSLICRSLKGDRVEFGRVARDSVIEDSTWHGARGYHIQFSPRVKLVQHTTPNGQVEYQVVVE